MTALYVGLMSGTSMDGIDAALIDCFTHKPHLVATHSKPWPDTLKQQLHDARQLDDEAVFALKDLDNTIAQQFAEAALELLTIAGTAVDEVIAIGSHGQTIRHRPHADTPFSLQLGNGQRIADLTRIRTVSDFRSADIAAGGEGAPLAPAFHNVVLRSSENRCVVNIGGVTNITLLPADASIAVSGYDSGPGNNLMDFWIQHQRSTAYDSNGEWARSGRINNELLARLKADAYFHEPPPKSTGFEHFNLDWLKQHDVDALPVEDVQATLCELTATTITDAILASELKIDRVLICGGGVHNAWCLQRLQSLLGEIPVESTQHHGVHPDWVEAMAFAWLAMRHLEGKPGNLPSVTGASESVVLGRLSRPDL
ncbi:MAG: anhydro-N-acetylmuramic acid kinase [Thiotrichales bacterium]|nr:MAG: anhydro-N-acetylmuramic acid kinase [Thiotrichales bacterium]